MLRPAAVLLVAIFHAAEGQLPGPGSPNTATTHGKNNVDPPWCATRAALFVNDATGIAQQAVAITGDCIGDAISDTACAGDVFSLLVSTTDGAEALSDLSNACAGEQSTCVSMALDSCEYLMTLAVNLIGASINCDTDVFICLINCIDSFDNIIDLASDIRLAVQTCPITPITTTGVPPRLLPTNKTLLAQVAPPPSTLTKYKKGEVSPFYASIVSMLQGTKLDSATGGYIVSTTGSGSSGGNVVDDMGIQRFGSRYVVPHADGYLSVAGDNQLHDQISRRLKEGDLTFPVQEVTQIEAHDTEVYFFGNEHGLTLLEDDDVSNDDMNDIWGFSDVAYE